MTSSSYSAAELRVPRILVVDDTPDNLFLMNGLLEDRYEVLQAASGREALDIVMSAYPPDMVLLDIMMPGMDGYEVMRRIRQHPPTANIPIIFLTALSSQQDERLGRDLGAEDYLTKPVDPEQVVLRIEAHVRATAQARRLDALSEKLSRHLQPEVWQRLFHGADAASIGFEERMVTVLYAETLHLGGWGEGDRDRFETELQWLSARHGGTIDRFVYGAAVVFFDEPEPAVRMALDLQRAAFDLQLRVGVHTGVCDVAEFAIGHERRVTLVGDEVMLAARVAGTSSVGSVAIAPEAYALVQQEIESDADAGVVREEFRDSDFAQAQLTPAPQGPAHGLAGASLTS
jgi:adenylate cyclase